MYTTQYSVLKKLKKSLKFFSDQWPKMNEKSKIKCFTANETILDIFTLYEVVLE